MFNISNKLFVTLDVLLDVRFHVRLGEPIHNCCISVMLSSLLHICQQGGVSITSEEKRYLEEKLYDGYFAFEAVTNRKWDDAICGIIMWHCTNI